MLRKSRHVLPCVKPGAVAGQVLLVVDLSVVGDSTAALTRLQALGYAPSIRHVSYATGVHVFAVLKDEYPPTLTEDYLVDEWVQLCAEFPPDSVHLRHGKQAV